MKARWNNMTTADRIINVLIIVLSVAVIALAALQLLGIWEDSINVYEPLIGVVLLLQAKLLWTKNRKIAVMQLCAAGFVFICTFVILILPLFRQSGGNAMGNWFMMLGFNLLIPAIMLGAGKLFLKKAPKNINWIFGYRTTMSMKNEDTWYFAHKVAGAFWLKWGWITLAITVVTMLLILNKSDEVISVVGCIILFAQMIPLIAVIPHTEKALHNTFDKDGTRKVDASC